MMNRTFKAPTEEDIKARTDMYKKADELGIDLMGFDDSDDAETVRADRSDIRKAVVYLGQGKDVPAELKERLLSRKGMQAE
jgi:hypothetical protein